MKLQHQICALPDATPEWISLFKRVVLKMTFNTVTELQLL